MAFRKKHQSIIGYKPDILIVQECENLEKLQSEDVIQNCTSTIWIGENKHKGVGVFSFSDYKLSIAKFYTDAFKYIVPIQVSGPESFLLFAIWAMPIKNSTLKSYVGQIWDALQYYEEYINNTSIFIGDFNSNQIWDKQRKNGNHSDVVDFLKNKGLISIYHEFENEKHGQETQPTIYLLKNPNKPYHLDYCFVNDERLRDKTILEVGKYANWIKLSDHMPIIISHLRNLA